MNSNRAEQEENENIPSRRAEGWGLSPVSRPDQGLVHSPILPTTSASANRVCLCVCASQSTGSINAQLLISAAASNSAMMGL